jgi:MFS transporter, MHS family, citrate/tricarballylate:H+ symporter
LPIPAARFQLAAMTAAAPTVSLPGAPFGHALKARHVAAVTAGNALEFYDFLTYAFFAAQIGRTFFPSADAAGSLLASLATFGAGFLMRPVGALTIGRLADRFGRKPAMLLSFTLMGVAMTGLALTPSYHAIGIAAPILAIGFRLVQGLALGGEIGPNTAYLIEAAPANRRGLYVSFQYMSQDASVLVSGLVGYALARLLSDAALDAWGWRIAFILGASIVPFGLLLRRQLVETLPPKTPEAPTTTPAPGLTPSLRRIVGLGIIILAGGTTVSYVMDYLTTYATSTLHMPTSTGFLATVFLGLTGVIFDPIGGWLSDRFGRKRTMLAPWAFLLLATLPGFFLLASLRSSAVLIGLSVVLTIAASLATPSVLVSITESIPARIRAGSLGLIYAFAISVFGGSTQFTVAWLTGFTHNPLAPAWYMSVCVAFALVAMIALPETSPLRTKVRRPRTEPT